jgi:hypothetical protein
MRSKRPSRPCADLLRFDVAVDLDAAARIFRRRRRGGITPRGMIDCMIASVAHRRRAKLLAFDSDLTRVADVAGIGMDEASRLTVRRDPYRVLRRGLNPMPHPWTTWTIWTSR